MELIYTNQNLIYKLYYHMAYIYFVSHVNSKNSNVLDGQMELIYITKWQ